MLYKPLDKKFAKKINKYDKGQKVIFVSQAKANMCWARLICKFVLEKGHVPVNYFTAFGHFVYELANQQTMIDAINSLVVRCDELWAFGEISEGVWFEIKMCKELGIPVRYFCIQELPERIKEISETEVEYLKDFREEMENNSKFRPISELFEKK